MTKTKTSLDLRLGRLPVGFERALLAHGPVLGEAIERAGFSDGTWQAYPVEQIRWRGSCGHRVRPTRVNGRSVRVKCRPGGNETAWLWDVLPPSTVPPERLYGALMPEDAEPEPDEAGAGAKAPVAGEPVSSLAARIAALEAAAQRGAAAAAEAAELVAEAESIEREAESLLAQSHELRQRALALSAAADADPEAKAAAAALAALARLLG